MDTLHSLSLADLTREHARSWPDQLAAACGDVRLTYAELDNRVTRLANVARDVGVGPEDRVAWTGQNCHRLIETLLAAARIGAIFAPMNWRQSAAELTQTLTEIRPSLVIWQETEVGDASRAARENIGDARWIQHDAPDGYETLIADASDVDPSSEVDAASPVLMMMTAAFTGRPKGALLSHVALWAQSLALAPVQGITSEYTYLNCGPLFHMATFMTTLATFVHAGTNVFTPRVDAEEICRLIEAEGCNGAFLMPPTIEQIVEVNAERKYDLSSLDALDVGNDAWREMVTIRASGWSKRPGGYGQTEATGLVTYSAFGGGGRPSPAVSMRVLDDSGEELPAGEVGELVIRGPVVMNGYFDDPEATAERNPGDGWHRTHDLGKRETDGSITFVGPMSRLIKSAAENVYPEEVEACLREHPAVADVCVFGEPDPTWGQNVCAAVVMRGGEEARAEDLIDHCRERIASYKKPKRVEVVEKLPYGSMGLDRDEVDALYGGGGYPGRG